MQSDQFKQQTQLKRHGELLRQTRADLVSEMVNGSQIGSTLKHNNVN